MMRVETKDAGDGRMFVALMGKARWPKKYVYAKTPEDAAKWVAAFEKEIADHAARLERRKTERKAARQMVFAKGNPFKVGDVLCHSWGYEQTNVEHYQVVATTERTVTYRQIACETVPGTQGFMSETVKPVLGAFIGEPVTKTLQAYAGGKEPYVPARHGWMGKVDPNEGAYRSWYA